MKSRRRLLMLAVLVLLIVGVILSIVLRPITLPPVILLPMPSPAPSPGWRERLMQKIPGWAWRLKLALLGPTRSVDLETFVLEFPAKPPAGLSELSLGKAHFASNAISAWVLSPQMLKTFRDHISQALQPAIIFHPRIRTSDGVDATLNVGNSLPAAGSPVVVGLTLSCAAHCRRQSINLEKSFCLTQSVTNQNLAGISVVTNLAIAARVQIPDQGGIFLLSPAIREGQATQIGTLICGTVR
jgi:hypothetical protein